MSRVTLIEARATLSTVEAMPKKQQQHHQLAPTDALVPTAHQLKTVHSTQNMN